MGYHVSVFRREANHEHQAKWLCIAMNGRMLVVGEADDVKATFTLEKTIFESLPTLQYEKSLENYRRTGFQYFGNGILDNSGTLTMGGRWKEARLINTAGLLPVDWCERLVKLVQKTGWSCQIDRHEPASTEITVPFDGGSDRLVLARMLMGEEWTVLVDGGVPKAPATQLLALAVCRALGWEATFYDGKDDVLLTQCELTATHQIFAGFERSGDALEAHVGQLVKVLGLECGPRGKAGEKNE